MEFSKKGLDAFQRKDRHLAGKSDGETVQRIC